MKRAEPDIMKRRSRGISRRGFLACAGALGAFAALSSKGCAADYDYSPLIALWRRRQALEARHLKLLRFTLSPNQISAGTILKLGLRDQGGEDWIFKVGPVACCGARTVYELGTLFGWETPEIHHTSVVVNGKSVRGTLQRLVPDAQRIVGFVKQTRRGIDRLTPRAWRDLLESQLFGWISVNHHLHIMQFIGTMSAGRVARVQRIDNTVEWYLVGHDRLDESFMTPILAVRMEHHLLGYGWMWDLFRRGLTQLPLAEVYALACFIAAAPDEIYAERFARGIDNDFDRFANVSTKVLRELVPDLVEAFDTAAFVPTMVARKKELPEAIAALFETELAKLGQRAGFHDGPSPHEIGERIGHGLEERIAELDARLGRLDPGPPPQQSINAVTSVEAYGIISQVLASSNIPKSARKQRELFSEAIASLVDLAQHAHNPLETRGIEHAVAHLEGLIEKPLSEVEARAQVCCHNAIFPVLPGSS